MAIAELEGCDPEFTSFITAILSVCADYALVEQQIQSSMESFRQFLFRRFPDHKALLFVEFDVKLVKDIDSALLADNRWSLGLIPNTTVYVIHLHGILHTRHFRGCEIAGAFQSTSDGKRSALYGGSRQVFVRPLDRIDAGEKIILDVRGVSGYATKAHFVPPVPTRMLEGLSEWLFVQDAIVKHPRSILVSGMRALKPYGGSRPTLKKFRALMLKMRNRLTPQERWEDELIDDTDHEVIETAAFTSDDGTSAIDITRTVHEGNLNSDLLSAWSKRVNLVRKKLGELFRAVRWEVRKVAESIRRRYWNALWAGIPPPE